MILLKIPTLVRFRGPGSFDPALKGSALHGGSMGYPLPSTLTGIIASYGFYRGLCSNHSPLSTDDWCIVAKCVEASLKDLGIELSSDWSLRPGFIALNDVDGVRIYVAVTRRISEEFMTTGSIATSVFRDTVTTYVPLDKLIRSLNSILETYLSVLELYIKGRCSDAETKLRQFRNFVQGLDVVVPRCINRIGISLERSLKITRYGYLYSASDLDLRGSFSSSSEPSIALDVSNAKVIRNAKAPIRLSEGVPGWIEITSYSVPLEDVFSSSGCFALVQLTPILVPSDEELRFDTYRASRILDLTNIIGRLVEKVLARKVLSLSIAAIPHLCDSRISILVPGYSYAMTRYRTPRPAIVGTSITILECSSDDALVLYEKGVGEAAKLGWGTLLPIPLKEELCSRVKELREKLQRLDHSS